jgi:hypothetical protein
MHFRYYVNLPGIVEGTAGLPIGPRGKDPGIEEKPTLSSYVLPSIFEQIPIFLHPHILFSFTFPLSLAD